MSEESTRKVVTTRERERKKIARTTTDALYSVCVCVREKACDYSCCDGTCVLRCALYVLVLLLCVNMCERESTEREREEVVVSYCVTRRRETTCAAVNKRRRLLGKGSERIARVFDVNVHLTYMCMYLRVCCLRNRAVWGVSCTAVRGGQSRLYIRRCSASSRC